MKRWFVVVAVALVAACGAFGDNSDANTTAAASDAGGSETGAPSPDGAVPADAGSEAGRSGEVFCNTGVRSSCKVGTEVCCMDFGQTYDECIAAPASFGLAASCGSAVDASDTRIIACDDSSECAVGEVCCADLSVLSRLNSACVPAANCNHQDYFELCKSRGLACANGKSCNAIAGYDHYSRCE